MANSQPQISIPIQEVGETYCWWWGEGWKKKGGGGWIGDGGYCFYRKINEAGCEDARVRHRGDWGGITSRVQPRGPHELLPTSPGEDLYLNPASWYTDVPHGSLSCHLHTRVIDVEHAAKRVVWRLCVSDDRGFARADTLLRAEERDPGACGGRGPPGPGGGEGDDGSGGLWGVGLGGEESVGVADRGGIVVGDDLGTSVEDVYAIGECASWRNQTFGLIAPGIEMADVLSFNLTQAKMHAYRKFKRPDLSTKLKDGPKNLPAGVLRKGEESLDAEGKSMSTDRSSSSQVRALTYKDPFQGVYKKYLFTMDGKYILGGMMIGDTKDYVKLVPMVKNQKMLDVPPSQFILGVSKEGDEGGDDLDDDTQICSCHNVSKGDVIHSIKEGTCKSLGDVKSCTKAGTGCGGCMPLVTSIFNRTMKSLGQEVKNHICPHFAYSRADLYHIISVKELRTWAHLPVQPARHDAADARAPGHTNDRFLANIQRNGTFSVVPRVPAGEITPEKLILLGQVAQKYRLYTKITGGQRIDMFGAKKQQLLPIWKELVDGGMESGHAYAKSLRTVKSCVGTSWCRFGIGDSVGMAVRLEERYKSIRSPHKIKGGVSGCVRECAEALNKDFGLIATEKGFNIFVGGNGGATPRHSDLLAKDVPPDSVIPILDRYLIFYIRTADRLQRTARWLEALPGGIKYLREVILEDRLGICASLEAQMEELVASFFDEWKVAVEDAGLRERFRQFGNCGEEVEGMEAEVVRGQVAPVAWVKESAATDFRNVRWSRLAWERVISAAQFRGADEVPGGISACVKRGDTQLAVWRVGGRWLASQQMCPHKRALHLIYHQNPARIADPRNKYHYKPCLQYIGIRQSYIKEPHKHELSLHIYTLASRICMRKSNTPLIHLPIYLLPNWCWYLQRISRGEKCALWYRKETNAIQRNAVQCDGCSKCSAVQCMHYS
ncbi:hypothetical protein EYC84_006867 [Monilinia fructicola]|uniref:Nitrite reductase [NAD(P)H] n=1 Tax=Monilinia fructicola TaxID=38448 RepID=A0A5M9K4S6_MONFR|nr:hypothetical protein EYC84_006867 [Monilinia fructicola]